MALDKNPLHKAAMADTKAAMATVREAQGAAVAKNDVRGELVRGNDPVFVFGTRCGSRFLLRRISR